MTGLGPLPMPPFDVAVGKGKIASLVVPVCREIPPMVRSFITVVGDDQGSIVNARLLFVREREGLNGTGDEDL